MGAKDAVGTAADDATHSHLLGYAGTCALESWTQRAALAARARCAFLFAPSHPFGINLCARPELKKRSWQTPTWRGVASLQEYFQAQIVSARERERGGERERLRGHEFAAPRRPARHGAHFVALPDFASVESARTHTLAITGPSGEVFRASGRANRAGARAGTTVWGSGEWHPCVTCARGRAVLALGCVCRRAGLQKAPKPRLRASCVCGHDRTNPRVPRRLEPRHAEQPEPRPLANPLSHFFFPSCHPMCFHSFSAPRNTQDGHKTQHVQRGGQSHRIPRPGSLISISVLETEPGIRFCTVPRKI